MRNQPLKDLVFDLFVFGGRFDDEIGLANFDHVLRRLDAAKCVLHVVRRNQITAHLTRHVLVDACNRGLKSLGRDIIQHDIIARQGHHMRNPVAHLTCANDAD